MDTAVMAVTVVIVADTVDTGIMDMAVTAISAIIITDGMGITVATGTTAAGPIRAIGSMTLSG